MNIILKQHLNNSKEINWVSIHKKILRLQTRITKQLEKKNFRQVRILQRLLTKSFVARLLISQKLMEEKDISKFKSYKKTRDGLFLHALNLNNFIQTGGYEAFKSYPRDFSSIYVKSLELLWLLAFVPVNETLSDHLSYNSRLYRIQTDVLKELYYTLNYSKYIWLLIIKPTGFFKKENEKWLLKNSLLEKKLLRFIIEKERLANTYREDYKFKEVLETKKISLNKLIRSSCFYGLSQFESTNLLDSNSKTIEKYKSSDIPIIYYSDIIFVPGRNLVELREIYKIIFQFLDQRGLIIQKNRLWIINLLYGFNFLGWCLKKDIENNQVTITISRENIKSHQLDIKKFLKSARYLPIDKVIIKLNRKITNWQYYYSYTPKLYRTWSEMNHYLFWRIWSWCKKRHKNKGSKWLYSKYWFYNEKNKWVFHDSGQFLKKYELKCLNFVTLPGSINACKIQNWKINQTTLLTRFTKI